MKTKGLTLAMSKDFTKEIHSFIPATDDMIPCHDGVECCRQHTRLGARGVAYHCGKPANDPIHKVNDYASQLAASWYKNYIIEDMDVAIAIEGAVREALGEAIKVTCKQYLNARITRIVAELRSMGAKE